MNRIAFIRLLSGFALAGWAGLPRANTLLPPHGKVILTVSGRIGASNVAGQATFDMAMLEALPQHTFTTQTPWEKEPIRFTGPLLRDVLGLVRATGKEILATALNDYQVRIPIDDARRFSVIVAHRLNGQPMQVRDRGPLFIVYPFDSQPELKSMRYYERSIWQVRRLTIE